MEILVTYYRVYYHRGNGRSYLNFGIDLDTQTPFERAKEFYQAQKDRGTRPTLVKITEQILAHP